MSFFKVQEIEKILAFAIEAGEIAARAFLNKDFLIERKADNSQVTSADIAVSKFLRQKLGAEFSQIPIICEEGDLREIEEDIFFLIDPIDGTSSFASGSVEFAVNIALVQNKKAVFGLIYAPLFEGGKMVFCNHEGQVILQSGFEFGNFDQKNLSQKNAQTAKDESLKIITGLKTKNEQIKNFISQFYPNFLQNFSVERLSSAVKFIHLLEKKSDFYLNFRSSMEWDTASGQALVEVMGGKVKNLFFTKNQFSIGNNLTYKKADFLNKAFMASF